MNGFEGLALANKDYIAEQYRRWKDDPRSVDESWQLFFAGFELAADGQDGAAVAFPAEAAPGRGEVGSRATAQPVPDMGAFDLVHSYRELGPSGRASEPARAQARRPSAPRPLGVRLRGG